MIIPPNALKIYVATDPVDFRKGMDGLAAIVSSALELDPFCGAIFIFRSKRADRLKLLLWTEPGWCWSRSAWRPRASSGPRCARAQSS